MSFVLKLLLGAAVRPALFIAAKTPNFTNGSDTVSYAGAQAGDLCVIWKSHEGTDVTGYSVQAMPSRGWDPSHGAIYWKVLTAGDIAAGSVSVTTSGGCTVAAAIYRGPTSVYYNGSTYVSQASVTSLTVPAYAPIPGLDMAVVSLCGAQNPSAAPTKPTGANLRGSNANSFYSASFADFIPAKNLPAMTWGLGATTNGDAFTIALR